jgi:hypothetical protein
MSLIKALFLSGILTFVVSEAIHAGKSKGGYLNIQEYALSGHFIQFSWPLFIVAAGMIWGILLMMR